MARRENSSTTSAATREPTSARMPVSTSTCSGSSTHRCAPRATRRSCRAGLLGTAGYSGTGSPPCPQQHLGVLEGDQPQTPKGIPKADPSKMNTHRGNPKVDNQRVGIQKAEHLKRGSPNVDSQKQIPRSGWPRVDPKGDLKRGFPKAQFPKGPQKAAKVEPPRGDPQKQIPHKRSKKQIQKMDPKGR